MAVNSNIANPPAQRTGTGFINLSKFLNANQDNQLGNTVSQGVSGLAQGAQQGLGSSQQQFQNDLQTNAFNTPQNKDYTSNTINQAEALGGGQALNQSDVNNFSQLRSGQYNGPQGLNNQQQLLGAAQEAQGVGQATLTDPGRQALLQRFVGTQNPYGSYTQGEQSLDTMLLGQQQPQLQQAQRSAQGLIPKIQSGINLANQQAQTTSQQNQLFGQQLGQKLGSELQKEQGTINNAVDTANQKGQQDYTNLLNALKSNKVSGTSLSNLAGTQTYGVDPTQYLTQGLSANAQNIATPAQLAQYNALSQLSGQQNTFIPQLAATAYDPTQATQFNQPAFNSAVGNAQQTYNQGLNAPSTLSFNSSGYGLTPNISLAQAQQILPQLQAKAALGDQTIAGFGGDVGKAGMYAYNSERNDAQKIQAALDAYNKQFGGNPKLS